MTIGLILAGGAGSRLGGVRKFDVRVGNRTLLAHALAALESQCDAVIVSAGRFVVPNHLALADDPNAVMGPAAGLLAGARWCLANAVGSPMLSIAVDTPYFPKDFGTHARPRLRGANRCVVGRYDGRDYPTCALWDHGALRDHLGALPSEPRGPRLRDIQSALGVVPLDYTALTDRNPFAGINTLPDLLALQDRAISI